MSVVEYKGYQGSVTYEDGRLVVEILHINDMVSTQCDAASEVSDAFAELVDDYLETCKAVGKSPEKPFSGSFNVRVGPELHRAAAHAAARQGVSLNAWICTAIKEQSEQGRPSPPMHEDLFRLFSLTRQSVWAPDWHQAQQLVHHVHMVKSSEVIDQFLSGQSSKATPAEVDFTSRKPASASAGASRQWKN